jgi:hypothetical protein
MMDSSAFVVLYRWRIKAGHEQRFIEGWSVVTRELLARGSHGARLHHGDDGIWYSYAQWSSQQARRTAFGLPSDHAEARAWMAEAVAESLPEVVLTVDSDLLRAIGGAPGVLPDASGGHLSGHVLKVTAVDPTQWQSKFWIRWLQIVLGLLIAYALVLVLAGSLATWMFTALGFGPSPQIDSDGVRDYLRLPLAVLGAVMAGWALQMVLIVRGATIRGAASVFSLLALPVGLWFILDTGMSILLGYPTHALFNLPFALALGIPLWRLRAIGRASTSEQFSPRGPAA